MLAADVVQANNDQHQLQPMMNAADQAARRLDRGTQGAIGVVLADAGYYSDDNVTAPGPDRLIAPASMLTLTGRRPTSTPPPQPGTPRAQMHDRLANSGEQARYKRRGQLVEPVFGQIKEQLGLRRFSRRGLPAAQSEWTLVCMVNNLLKLHRSSRPAPA